MRLLSRLVVVITLAATTVVAQTKVTPPKNKYTPQQDVQIGREAAAAMARRGGQPPSTFTIGFPGHGSELDERAYAAQSARLIGTSHRDTAMEEADYLDELSRSVRRLEEPVGIPSAPALMQLSRFAAGSVKVVLSGQGADEPHGGYGRHQAAAACVSTRSRPDQKGAPSSQRPATWRPR